MREDTLLGASLAEALENPESRLLAQRAKPTCAPGPQKGPEDGRVPYIVRESDGELVYALFRVPDPAKELEQDE